MIMQSDAVLIIDESYYIIWYNMPNELYDCLESNKFYQFVR